MPTASIKPEILPTLEADRTISEVTTSVEGAWVEIVYDGGRRTRMTLSDINDARDDGIAPLLASDLECPRLRQGKKVMLGKRVIDANWLICLAEVYEP